MITAAFRPNLRSVFALLFMLAAASAYATAQDAPVPAKVTVDADGKVHVPPLVIPGSSFLSPEAKAYLAQHLIQMQNPELVKQEHGVPRFMKPYIERDNTLFAVEKKDLQIAGVHVYEYTPKDGISSSNEHRVLVNLHGGGFQAAGRAAPNSNRSRLRRSCKSKLLQLITARGQTTNSRLRVKTWPACTPTC